MDRLPIYILCAVMLGLNFVAFRVIVPALVNMQHDSALIAAAIVPVVVLCADYVFITKFFAEEGTDQ